MFVILLLFDKYLIFEPKLRYKLVIFQDALEFRSNVLAPFSFL